MSQIINAERYDAGTNEEYHAGEGVSNSMLSLALDNPAEYHGRFIDGSIERPSPTPDQLIGTYTHEIVLEDRLSSGVVVPEGKTVVTAERFKTRKARLDGAVCVPREVLDENGHCRGSKYIAWRAQFSKATKCIKEPEYRELERKVADAFVIPDGANAIDNETLDQLGDMIEALEAHEDANRFLFSEGCESEVALRGTDAGTGILCRCKLDRLSLNPSDMFIADLKTTNDVSTEGFARTVAKFGYHRQQVFYSRIAEAMFGQIIPFYFVVVSKKKPYRVETYQLDPDWIPDGESDVDKALREIARCQRSGVWQHEHYGATLCLPKPRFLKYKNEWEVN